MYRMRGAGWVAPTHVGVCLTPQICGCMGKNWLPLVGCDGHVAAAQPLTQPLDARRCMLAAGPLPADCVSPQDYLVHLPLACPQLPAAWLPLLADELAGAPLSKWVRL